MTGGFLWSISIHALREEGDSRRFWRSSKGRNFYPRPPRGGRRLCSQQRLDRVPISIHALREEGDSSRARANRTPEQFLSTPSARRATIIQDYVLEGKKFLSTPSARRATVPLLLPGPSRNHFYPRPPRGGRRVDREACLPRPFISIHALREEGDIFRS